MALENDVGHLLCRTRSGWVGGIWCRATCIEAAEAFFDPFFKMVDASRHDEARDAIIGSDHSARLLFVVHLLLEDDRIRLISARQATREERRYYEDS